jgi:hypothetical protein
LAESLAQRYVIQLLLAELADFRQVFGGFQLKKIWKSGQSGFLDGR